MGPWWKAWPGRLEYELSELKGAGIPYKKDEAAFENGKLVLELNLVLGGETLRLRAVFPDLYPHFRFEIIAPDLSLRHHQNPFLKNLCMIPADTGHWFPTDTLASFVVERLPKVLEAARAEKAEDAGEIEVHQAEPLTAYYEYLAGGISVDSSWVPDEALSRGRLVAGLDYSGGMARGVVLETQSAEGARLYSAGPALQNLYRGRVEGTWLRLDEPIFEREAAAFSAELFKRAPAVSRTGWSDVGNLRFNLTGVAFPEERTHWRRKGLGWVFLLRVRAPGGRSGAIEPGRYLVRALGAGRIDLLGRAPELRPLGEKRVAIFGLGCIGAPAAVELARATVGEIALVDFDFAEPAGSMRWPLGIMYGGIPKVLALQQFIQTNYPHTRATPYPQQLGSALAVQRSDLEVLEEIFQGLDLVLDASAETGIQDFLSVLAGARGIPYICAYATPGGWGGYLVRVLAGRKQGCWLCFRHGLADGKIPTAPFDQREFVQPAGCAAPTFRAASFDVGHISTEAARLAAATLCEGAGDSYPALDWDVGVLYLRDSRGVAMAPRWEILQLVPHPSCEYCRGRTKTA